MLLAFFVLVLAFLLASVRSTRRIVRMSPARRARRSSNRRRSRPQIAPPVGVGVASGTTDGRRVSTLS
jgi:hypothetical protein